MSHVEKLELLFETQVGNNILVDVELKTTDCEASSDYGNGTTTQEWTETEVVSVRTRCIDYGGPDATRYVKRSERLEWFELFDDLAEILIAKNGVEAYQ